MKTKELESYLRSRFALPPKSNPDIFVDKVNPKEKVVWREAGNISYQDVEPKEEATPIERHCDNCPVNNCKVKEEATPKDELKKDVFADIDPMTVYKLKSLIRETNESKPACFGFVLNRHEIKCDFYVVRGGFGVSLIDLGVKLTYKYNGENGTMNVLSCVKIPKDEVKQEWTKSKEVKEEAVTIEKHCDNCPVNNCKVKEEAKPKDKFEVKAQLTGKWCYNCFYAPIDEGVEPCLNCINNRFWKSKEAMPEVKEKPIVNYIHIGHYTIAEIKYNGRFFHGLSVCNLGADSFDMQKGNSIAFLRAVEKLGWKTRLENNADLKKVFSKARRINIKKGREILSTNKKEINKSEVKQNEI